MDSFPGVAELEVAEILVGLAQKILNPLPTISWSSKRIRSSSPCKAIFATGSSSMSLASPESVAILMPPLPLPVNVENRLSAVEEISQLILTVSNQKEALVDGMEAAMKFYNRLKVYKMSMENNESLECIHKKMQEIRRLYLRIRVQQMELEKKEQILKMRLEGEERNLRQRQEEEERNLRQRQEEEDRRHAQQNHNVINNNNNNEARALFDLNFPPMEN